MKISNAQNIDKPLAWYDDKLEAETGDGWFVDTNSSIVKLLLFLLSMDPPLFMGIC